MRFGVLGPLAVWTDDGDLVHVPGLKVRALLADLLVHEGHPVSVDRLIEDLWGETTPAKPSGALQVRVSQLRRALEDAEPGGRELVVSRAPGYLLRVESDAVDAARFAVLTERARAIDDPRTRTSLLSDALALWRGPAFADFVDEAFARAAAARLDEQRLAVLEEHAEARLALGEHSSLAAELGDLVTRHPYREQLRSVHMRALYGAGRQREALDSYHELRRLLAAELGLDPSPELAALHQAILEQDPAIAAEAKPAITTARPTTNLPASLGELVGRDEAVSEVRSLLAAERLVTLTGSGGVGKTRLALEVARTLTGTFASGVWLVELAALDRPGHQEMGFDPAELVMAVLDIRDDPAPAEPATARERVAAALRDRELLLVLDNCEHLVEQVAGLVEPLLRAVPRLRILASSREPLGLTGEVVWEVPPLEVPEGSAGLHPAQLLARSSAVRLFVARAAAAARGFTLDTDNAPAVVELCRRLDGIPLALELAATRVRVLGVYGLVARLDDRFRLLTAGHRDAPPRQRTLTAVIDWSWRLLTEPERVVLRRLAVHADGCTLEAAEAVCAGDEVVADEVLDLLARLVDRSLVVMDEQARDGPRYRLLESVAAYSLDRLREAGELTRVRQRHADYYLDLAQRVEPHLYGHGQRRWLRRLDAEAANLRAAMDNVVRRGAAEQALRLVGALAWYWFLRGRLTEVRRSLAAALGVSGDAPAAVRAKALAWEAGMALLQGDTDERVARHQAVLKQYEDADDPGGQARAEWFLAYAMIDLGDLATTDALVDRALRAFRELGDRWGEAAALTTRAKLAHVRGDFAVLGRDARRSTELFRELGDQWGVLQATGWLIGLAEMTGDYEEATRLSHDGLLMAEELGLWPDVAGQLSWLGWIAVQLGDYAQARECCEHALRLASEQGFQAGEAFAMIGLAFAARRDGKLDLAEARLRRLVELARRQEAEGSQPLYLSMVLAELGHLAVQRGDPAMALDLHRESFDIAQGQDDPRGMAWALDGMAAALTADARHLLAARLLGVAAAARRSMGFPPPPGERDEINRITDTARAALGDEPFDAAFASGGQLTPKEARSLFDDGFRSPGGVKE